MLEHKSFILLAILTIESHVRSSTKNRRIHAGVEDLLHEFTFAVVIYRDQGGCSGSLISPEWVLTAAHCIDFHPTETDFVRYADFRSLFNETKAKAKIIQTFQHPSYKSFKASENLPSIFFVNDIGLAQIERVSLTPGSLSAVNYKSMGGLEVKYAGFGSNSVREVKQEKIRNGPVNVGEGVVIKCSKVNGVNMGPILCAETKCSNKHQWPRLGDSGGPLLYDRKIVGIVTGYTELLNFRVIFTPVSPHLEWIEYIMK